MHTDASCLVVGLGNWNVTPDALGPLTVESLLVTRHLFELRTGKCTGRLPPSVLFITGSDGTDRH
ncbi:GPR endopeptidase [Bacillus sp. SL00103]